MEYAAAHIQPMQKALMEMNLQLHHVVSDITGATGMRIIRAIVAGERNPDVLATYRDVRCHSSAETIRSTGGHHRRPAGPRRPVRSIVNDDGAGESADVVAMRLAGSKLVAELYHCKYSADPKAGARLDDLYVVCGQTQKSIRWRERPDIFLNHLLERESDRKRAGRPSRFEKGTRANVIGWLNRWQKLHYEFHAIIVQPGLSKAKAEQSHLELFSATQSLLMDTWG